MKQLVCISRSGRHTLQKYGFCILLTTQHVIVHHVSYKPKEKKKLSKGSFKYGYLFWVLLKSFSLSVEESSRMMNSGLYVKMLIEETTVAENPWSNGIVERHNAWISCSEDNG